MIVRPTTAPPLPRWERIVLDYQVLTVWERAGALR
jgi:hypothetical protein